MATQTLAAVPDVDHTMLPEKDNKPVDNHYEHPQSIMLTEAARPVFDRIHPDGQYLVGQASGIYFKLTNPPLDGCRAPDWFYVPGVPPTVSNWPWRRSYVLWKEVISPHLIIELASEEGKEERDATPHTGKFWIYERAIKAAYYAIHVPLTGDTELYELAGGKYRRVKRNARNHFAVEPLGLELGLWREEYQGQVQPWLRFYDRDGELLPVDAERAEQERRRAEEERARAEQERQRAEQQRERAEQESQRADHERQRADAAATENARLRERLRQLGIDPDA